MHRRAEEFLQDGALKRSTKPLVRGEPTLVVRCSISFSTFVKTFKRGYVRLNPRPDAATVMAALDAWFEDYNEMHPHRALGMRSPRQFIRAHHPATCPV